eukprot:ctg_4602.g637
MRNCSARPFQNRTAPEQ